MPKPDDDFDLLTDVECFLRRGHDSPWGTDWLVHAEHADDFEAYLQIIDVPYRRQLASHRCRCPEHPPRRLVAFFRVCEECDPVAWRMFA